MDSASGIVIAGVTAGFSYILGRVSGKASIHDRYYNNARIALKRLIVDVANIINRTGASGFKPKHRKQILRINDAFWSTHADSLAFFLYRNYEKVESERAKFETALENLLNTLLPEGQDHPKNLTSANSVFQEQVRPQWKLLFEASFPAVPLQESEVNRYDDLMLRKDRYIYHFKAN